jgi:hypothetical protein
VLLIPGGINASDFPDAAECFDSHPKAVDDVCVRSGEVVPL